MRHRIVGSRGFLTAIVLAVPAAAIAARYDDARAEAVRKCEAIDPASYQSGLFFNPDGYRSYYLRSQCLQEAAVQFRDETLCRQVRQRRALFSSSWGYSARRCRDLVKQGLQADEAELQQMKADYTRLGMRLRDFRIERNGNGRDFDIIPAFEGGYAHGYRLVFEIVTKVPAAAPALLHADGYYVDTTSQLRIFVRQSEIRARFPEFVLGTSYAVRATMVLEVGRAGSSSYWSDRFIARMFPVTERSNALTKQVVF
jgi:hypothetical protein